MANISFNSVTMKYKSELFVEDSKFVCIMKNVKNENEINSFLDDLKKEYVGAKHICYAYSFYNEKTKQKKEKSSDNGEPKGTAGAPILSVIKNHNLSNICLAVVRFFGGTLLGTGLLTRSYAQSAEKTVKASVLIPVAYMGIYELTINYTEVKKIEQTLEINCIKLLSTDYLEDVVLTIAYVETDHKKNVELLSKVLGRKIEIEKVESRFV